jgi:transcriptional regulator with XRE-family HTH domain
MAQALARKLETMRERGGIRARDVAELLGTSPQTVSRWQQGRTEPHREKLQRLLVLEWVIDQLAEFYSPEEARLWLYAPHRLLLGETPANKIAQGSIDEVIAIINQLKDGAYV